MKKINFSISELPDENVFNEILFKQENPEMYKTYLLPQTDKTKMETIKNWISNILTRAINGIEIDKKENREKPTKSADLETNCNFARVINAIKKEKEGWVKMEDSDFKFLCDKWHEGKIQCYENVALTLAVINEAIETAKTYKGNPDK